MPAGADPGRAVRELLLAPAGDTADRRSRAVPGLLLSLLLLLAGGDAAARRAEAARLAAAVSDGEAAARYAERRVAATAEYAGPALTSTAVGEAVQADLRRLVRREAVAQVPALLQERDRVRALPALPWHREVVQARDAYAGHLDALAEHLGAVEDDLARLYERPEELAAARERARTALRAVLPAGGELP